MPSSMSSMSSRSDWDRPAAASRSPSGTSGGSWLALRAKVRHTTRACQADTKRLAAAAHFRPLCSPFCASCRYPSASAPHHCHHLGSRLLLKLTTESSKSKRRCLRLWPRSISTAILEKRCSTIGSISKIPSMTMKRSTTCDEPSWAPCARIQCPTCRWPTARGDFRFDCARLRAAHPLQSSPAPRASTETVGTLSRATRFDGAKCATSRFPTHRADVRTLVETVIRID